MEPNIEDVLNEEDDFDIEILDDSHLESLLKEEDFPIDTFESDECSPLPTEEKQGSFVLNPISILHYQTLQEAKSTEKKLKRPLQEKRQYSSRRYPITRFYEIKPISRKVSNIPTALAVSSHFLVIGNSQGQIFVFTHEGQEIKVMSIKHSEFGEVTSIDISFDEQIIVTGFEYGQLAVWDIRSGTCLRATNSLHSFAVVSVVFYAENQSQILSSDLTGKVLKVEFSRTLFSSSFQHEILVKGDFGVCLNMKFITDARLVVLGTLKGVFIYKTDPFLRLQHSLDKPRGVDAGVSPCLSCKNSVLAVAWDKKISLLDLNKSFEIFKLFEMDVEIKGLEWLSPDLLLAISKMRDFRVIRVKESSEHKFSIEDSIPKDIVPQIFVKYEDSSENMTLYNSVKSLKHCAYVLGKKEFSVCRLLDWKECLRALVDSSDWIGMLSFGLDVYSQKAGFFINGKYDVSEVKQTLITYFNKFIEESNCKTDIKIKYGLDFAVEIQATDLFFQKFLDVFIGNTQLLLLIEILEPYILSGLLKILPHPVQEKLIQYYMSMNRPDILDKVIIQLDPQCIMKNQVIPICIEHKLYNSLVYIYTAEKNYVKPYKVLEKAFQSQKDLKTRRICGYKLLWYISMCISGVKFPEGKILRDEYPQMLVSLLTSILKSRQTLNSLMGMDQKTTLEVFSGIFSEDSDHFLKHTSFQSELLSSLLSESRNLSFYHFAMFVSSLKSDVITKELKLQTVRELIKPRKVIFQRSFVHIDTIEKFVDSVADYQNYNDQSEQAKSSIILRLLEDLDLTPEDVENLFTTLTNSPYTEVLVYVQGLKGQTVESLKAFLKSEKEEVRLKLFDWLENIMTKIDEQALTSLKTVVMDKLDLLVKINTDRTAKLMTDWFPDKHVEIIHKLENAPQLQMKYLKELSRKKDAMTEDMAFMYINLLCKFRPSEVLEFLKTPVKYPLTETLNVCRDHNIHKATAYLYEEMGDCCQALGVYLVLISESKRNGRVQVEEFHEAISLCNRHASWLDEIENISLWFPLLVAILETIEENESNPQMTLFLKTTLEGMIDYIHIDKILEIIEERFGNLPLFYYYDALIQALSKYSYQENALKTAINLLDSNTNNIYKQFIGAKQNGICFNDGVCQSCGDLLVQCDKNICVFYCRHFYHQDCLVEDLCPLCNKK